jgi:hypothetical protein
MLRRAQLQQQKPNLANFADETAFLALTLSNWLTICHLATAEPPSAIGEQR